MWSICSKYTYRTWIFNPFECTDDSNNYNDGDNKMIVSCRSRIFVLFQITLLFASYFWRRMWVAFTFVENNFAEENKKDQWNMNAWNKNNLNFPTKMIITNIIIPSRMHFTIYKLPIVKSFWFVCFQKRMRGTKMRFIEWKIADSATFLCK